jgi:penicillin-binding protein 1A
MDGWFSGYGGNVVAVAWMGFDDPKSLGGREFGATVALPIWIDYMRVALAKKPQQEERSQPDGVVRENDDWVYAEFAETPTLGNIDLEQAPDPNAPPPAEGAPPGTPAPTQPQQQPTQQQPSNSLF